MSARESEKKKKRKRKKTNRNNHNERGRERKGKNAVEQMNSLHNYYLYTKKIYLRNENCTRDDVNIETKSINKWICILQRERGKGKAFWNVNAGARSFVFGECYLHSPTLFGARAPNAYSHIFIFLDVFQQNTSKQYWLLLFLLLLFRQRTQEKEAKWWRRTRFVRLLCVVFSCLFAHCRRLCRRSSPLYQDNKLWFS